MLRQFHFLVITLILLAPATCMAYVDPGSGMLLWQGLVAAFGALLVFVRHPLKAIKRFLDRLKGK